MKITLELFSDCNEFDGTLEKGLTHLSWQLIVEDKRIGELDSYENICKKLDTIFEIYEKFNIT